MTVIKCTVCGADFELTEALTKDIEKTLLAEVHAKHAIEMETAKKEADKEMVAAIAQAEERAKLDAAAKSQLQLEQAQIDAEESKKDNAELRGQLKKLMDDVRELTKARDNAELDAQRKLQEETTKIEEEAGKRAEERYRLKIAEGEKKLADTQKALEEARRKAEQGSQQTQGEVLELELEARLRSEFPLDEIIEVKKGQSGADVLQCVKNQRGHQSGTILWETKNGKWQPAWVGKFNQDIRDASANIGVIVSQELPADIKDMKLVDSNVWVVSPKLAMPLAVALRGAILDVDLANRMSANKDDKLESLYQFLVGPEFKHRIESIIASYTFLQNEIEREKRWYKLKWAKQEKAIRSVIDNTVGVYGDLQGITAGALPSIQTLELEASAEIAAFEDEIDDAESGI